VGAAVAVTGLAVPERDERDVRVFGCGVARLIQRVEEHPEVVTLPDAVVLLRGFFL
jgi:hypothetical protein